MAPPAEKSPTEALLDRLKGLHPRLIDLSLDRMWQLLAALGDPQLALPPVIHVAGTNGKGSLVAYLRAMHEAAGYRVHAYTSPHLVRLTERFVVAGQEIAEPALAALVEECEAANGGRPITQFEILTAAGFLAFARTPADLLVLETGLGGRLDATNVVPRPLAVALTPISLDHRDFLGDTLSAIAAEKAGILRPGRPAVIGPQGPEAAAVFAAQALSVGAPLFRHGVEWTAEATATGLRYAGRRSLDLPPPALAGAHQILNAATAVAVAEVIAAEGPALTDAAIAAGIAGARWPARLQRLTAGPLVAMLPAGWELWLDGGHNEDAGRAIAAHARAAWSDRPLHMIFGMQSTKDPVGYWRHFQGLPQEVRAVAIPDAAASLSAEQSAAAAAEAGVAAAAAPSVAEALRQIVRGHDRPPGPARLLICGSLYLAGAVLAENR
ncbi:MAG: folylpolyglutamate synthase/dihydrofolate synthase family protein [Thalassobaculales bacterium]